MTPTHQQEIEKTVNYISAFSPDPEFTKDALKALLLKVEREAGMGEDAFSPDELKEIYDLALEAVSGVKNPTLLQDISDKAGGQIARLKALAQQPKECNCWKASKNPDMGYACPVHGEPKEGQ